ncbi:MAG: hypothetical protein DRP65_00990 [Planctomycetota bacterium]|nr:MAG: hypothetical protein DRP65_00990 [Planctomycetota bacterium]
MDRLKILVSAYACSPYQGSEPGMGWGWIKEISRYHDLWVICEESESRIDVEAELEKNPQMRDRVKFFYIRIVRSRILGSYSLPSFYIYYKNWQKKVYKLACSLHEQIGFDLLHQLNMIGYREPGYLWKLPVPFVWGPVGGTADVPLRFASVLGPSQFLYHFARNTVNAWQLRYHNRVKAALNHADGFVTATSDEHNAFLRITGKDSVVISSTAIDTDENSSKPSGSYYETGNPLKLVYAGIHVSRKAIPIALRALALVPLKYRWHLDILGTGPMTSSWKHLATRLGINKNCTWHGWLPHRSDAVCIMERADALVFPSLQEGFPTVVLEALSKGLAVICFDHCGMADAVNNNCGIKIPVTTPKQAIQGFAEAVEQLAANPDELKRLSAGALKRAQEYSWQNRAGKMLNVYEKALSRRKTAS